MGFVQRHIEEFEDCIAWLKFMIIVSATFPIINRAILYTFEGLKQCMILKAWSNRLLKKYKLQLGVPRVLLHGSDITSIQDVSTGNGRTIGFNVHTRLCSALATVTYELTVRLFGWKRGKSRESREMSHSALLSPSRSFCMLTPPAPGGAVRSVGGGRHWVKHPENFQESSSQTGYAKIWRTRVGCTRRISVGKSGLVRIIRSVCVKMF